MSAREVLDKAAEPDITRRFTVRKRTVIEHTWILPEGIADRKQAKAMAEVTKAHHRAVIAEHWTVEQESKSDVVRRLFQDGYTASEVAKLTGWDYGFVYGVSWRDAGGR